MRGQAGDGLRIIALNPQRIHQRWPTFRDPESDVDFGLAVDDIGLHIDVGVPGILIKGREILDAAVKQRLAEHAVRPG